MKHVKIESGGTNYGESDIGDYLRIYINDVELQTFTRGLSVVIIDGISFSIDSITTYDSGDSAFDPTQLIFDIN